MQRLIKILSRYGYPILEPARDGLPGRMNHAQCGIAILDRFGDDANGHQIVNLIDVDALASELLIDRKQPLDTTFDENHLDVGGPHHIDYSLFHFFEKRLQPGTAALDEFFQFLILLRLEMLECEVFKFSSDTRHTEPVSDGCIDIEGFLRDAPSLLARKIFERAHVVKPVGKFDQNDSHVVDHRQQHLAHVECLTFFGRSMIELGYLGEPVYQMGYFRA